MAGNIPKSFIDQLLITVDIVEVIERRIPLTRKGKEHIACCPFHDEKTPSFSVSPAKQFYHCFGCGAHGNAIGFVMQYANLGFVEALEELAAAAGVSIPHSAPTTAPPTKLIQVMDAANQWFQQQLRSHPQAQQAILYLKQRGLDGRTSAAFNLGYAPPGWDNLARALGTKTNQQQLCQAGLCVKREQAENQEKQLLGGLYDRFRARVMFPIYNQRGQVVAFGGRSLGDEQPKYLNSPQTPLFYKGTELYALNHARRDIGNTKFSLVVEGYMDVLSLAQFDINNAVATMGTATTRTHVQQLFRSAPKIVFCFDGDSAGRTGAWHALQSALPEMHTDRQISFLFLPDGEDPDSLVRTIGKQKFIQLVQHAQTLDDFLFDHLIKQVDLATHAGKAKLVALANPLITQLPESALQEILWQRLTTETGLSMHQITKQPIQTPHRRTPPTVAAEQGQISPMAFALSMLLQNPQLATKISQPQELQQLTCKGADILLRLLAKITDDPDITTARLLELFRDEKVYERLATLATRTNLIAEATLATQFDDTLVHLLAEQTANIRAQLIEEFRKTQPQGEASQELQQRIKKSLAARKPI